MIPAISDLLAVIQERITHHVGGQGQHGGVDDNGEYVNEYRPYIGGHLRNSRFCGTCLEQLRAAGSVFRLSLGGSKSDDPIHRGLAGRASQRLKGMRVIHDVVNILLGQTMCRA